MTDKDEIQPSKLSDRLNSNRQVFKISLALGIGVALIYLAFLKPGIWGIDGNDMFWVSHSLVTEGDFSISKGAGVLGSGGEYYSIRYPLLPILATPFVAIGLGLGNLFNLPTRYTATLCALVLPILLTAVTTSLVALLALRLGSSKKGAYLAAISYAFGTTALVYAREFFAEPLLSLLTTASIYLALGKSYRSHAGAGILAGLAITAKPAGIVVGPVLTLYFFCKKYPWRTIVSSLMGTGMGVLLYMGYNYLRFESFFGSGQNTDRLQLTGMPERFFGLIFSPGAGGGLLWYCPPTILAILGFRQLFKSKPLEALLLLAIFLNYLVLHSFWLFKGWNWGPRFLVPTLPLLLALVAVLEKKWWDWIVALTLVGLFWNAPTLVSYYQRYYAEAVDRGDFNQALALWGSPLDAPLFNAWGAAFRQLGDAFSIDVRQVISNVGTPPELGNLASSDLLRIVAVWWWVLPAAGIPIWVGFILALILIGLGTWILWRGWYQLKDW
jgi:hypothetical protein